MATHFQDVANRGFANADGYDKHRPNYPTSAVNELLEELKLVGKHGARVLDLGAGTGKFTEVLAARDEKYNILAVEPQKNMRRQLEHKSLPNVEVKDGLSYDLPVKQDGTFDAVIAAQVSTHSLLALSPAFVFGLPKAAFYQSCVGHTRFL